MEICEKLIFVPVSHDASQLLFDESHALLHNPRFLDVERWPSG